MKVKIWLLTAFCVICFSLNSSQTDRVHNVRLACQKIDGTFLESGDTFSFNNIVGARTEKRGFRTAKIILGGRFVDGVGGGVCQVSTTLYNAVLLSGLKVVEQHPHSLAVGYVEPSFDAMVSYGYSDLKFINNTFNPIIIYASANGKVVTIKIYGQPLKETYQLKSVITGYIQPKDECLNDTDFDDNSENFEKQYVIYPKKGVISEGFLIKKVNGKVQEIKLLRKDKYLPINGVYIQKLGGID